MQCRTWNKLILGDLKRVTVGNTIKLAEVLDTSDMPMGRSPPKEDGVWLSFLGEDEVVKKSKEMVMCVHARFCRHCADAYRILKSFFNSFFFFLYCTNPKSD
jgi:hypothetical protein